MSTYMYDVFVHIDSVFLTLFLKSSSSQDGSSASGKY